MPIKYQKFGLRRDKNLADLANPTTALGNILDNLIDADSQTSFIPDDLLSAITGLRDTTLTAEDIQKTKATVRTYTDDAGNAIPFEPLQTIEDNIRNFKVYVGDPPFNGGGDGIEALFVPWDAMEDRNGAWSSANEATKKAWTGDQLYNNSYVAPNKVEPGLEGPFDFWDNGIFIFGAKLYNDFTDTFGLIQWEGYVQGSQVFDMETTGLLKIEIDKLDNGNWEFIKNVYDETRTGIQVVASSYDSGNDVSTLTLDDSEDSKVICIEDIADFGGANNTFTVTGLDQTTFTVEGDVTANNTFTPTTVDFSFELGGEQILRTGRETRVPSTAVGGLIKIRISYYFPNTADGRNFPEKRFVDFNEDATDRIPYSNFYTEVPTGNPGIYTYQYFEENRLSKRNKFISPRNSSEDTTALQTAKLVFANYTPPETFGSKYRGGPTVFWKGGDRFRVVADTSGFNSVSVGDWAVFEVFTGSTRKTLVATIEDIGTEVIDDVNYREVFIDKGTVTTFESTHGSITVDDECVMHVWKPEGLIGFVELNSSSSYPNFAMANMTGGEKLSYLNATADVLSDYMVAGSSQGMNSSGTIQSTSTFTHFKRIEKISNTSINTFNIYSGDSYTPISNSLWVAAVYAHTGLQDLSTLSQCAGTYGVEVTATAATGQAVIQVSDTSRITAGDYVQFGNTSGGTNYVSNFIAAGTTVSSVDSSTQITLSSNIGVGSTPEAIPQNATLVFVEQSQGNPGSNAKEFCVLPLNTAPPFTGTDEGLRTTSSSRGDATNFPNLVAEKLIFAEAQFPDVSALTEVDLTTNPQYGRTLSIDYNGTPYKFLIA